MEQLRPLPLEAKAVIPLMGTAIRKVAWLETEDRDRTADYVIEA